MSTPTQYDLQKWNYFCKETSKAQELLDLTEDMWSIIELRDNAYNPVIYLVIDSLTTKVFIHLRHLFDSQKDALRLSRVLTDKEFLEPLKNLKKEAKPFIDAVNREHAHISKNPGEINYDSNFRLNEKQSLDKIREILNEVQGLLRRWGVLHNNGGVIADRWGDIATSRELLVEALCEHAFLVKEMEIMELVEYREKMRERNDNS